MYRLTTFLLLLLLTKLCKPQCSENVTDSSIRSHLLYLLNTPIESTDPPQTPIIAVYYNCRAHSPSHPFFTTLSLTVEFQVLQPDLSPVMYTQIDFTCTNNNWISVRSSSPISNSSETALHSFYTDNCTECYVSASNPYHCLECDEVCSTSNFGYCTSLGVYDCCDFLWQDTCRTTCPNGTMPNLNNTCVCSEFVSGSNCDLCSYPCENNGTANAECDSCVCLQGYTDTNCSTEIDFCLTSPCPQNAVCHTSTLGHSCECKQGYTGTDCESEINFCLSQPCQNEGVCRSDLSGFSCICHEGTTGYDCSSIIDTCSVGNPCVNAAMCVNGIRGAECVCSREFTGRLCETVINFCETVPCANNGSCTSLLGNYTCSCDFPYTGLECENKIDHCLPGPCSNNTVDCLNTAQGPVCVCERGFTGVTCGVNIDECVLVGCNGGVCIDEVLGYKCECRLGLIGKDCEMNDVMLLCGNVKCENNGTCNSEYFVNADRDEVLLVAGGNFTYKPEYCNCNNEWSGVMCTKCSLECGDNQLEDIMCYRCICEGLWSGEDCLDCDYFIEGGTCVENCTLESYQVSINRTCFACGLPNCLLCNQSRPEECQECVSNYTLNIVSGDCEEILLHTTTITMTTTPSPTKLSTEPPYQFPNLNFGLPLGALLVLLIIIALVVVLYCMWRFKCCVGCGGGGGSGGGPSWWGWGSGRKQKVKIKVIRKSLDDDVGDVVVRSGNKTVVKKRKSKKKVDQYKHLECFRGSFEFLPPTAGQMPTRSESIELNENPEYSPLRQIATATDGYEFIYERHLPSSTPLHPSTHTVSSIVIPQESQVIFPLATGLSNDSESYRDSFTSESFYVTPPVTSQYENIVVQVAGDTQTQEYSSTGYYIWQASDSYQDYTQASDSILSHHTHSHTPL